ncbi:MAG: hypothetical protein PHY93_14840 [Bacteriovorax sp.]|nr:hypothetical protein [Bacteriovorax sp.]
MKLLLCVLIMASDCGKTVKAQQNNPNSLKVAVSLPARNQY